MQSKDVFLQKAVRIKIYLLTPSLIQIERWKR